MALPFARVDHVVLVGRVGVASTRPQVDATPLGQVDAALAALPDAGDLDTVRGL